MQALTLPARRGWLWLYEGFLLTRKSHVTLSLIVVSYWMLMAVINIVPVVGQIAVAVCIPIFSVSLMNACQAIEQNRLLSPMILLSGFNGNQRTLLVLGVAYLVGTLVILGLSSLVDGGSLFHFLLRGRMLDAGAPVSDEFVQAAQLALLFFAPLTMAYWFAPALVGWHGMSASKSIFFSLIACQRNWRAFLVYGFATVMCSAIIPGLVLGMIVRILPGGSAMLSALLTLLLVLVVAPTMYASFYISYRDIFVVIDENT